MKKVCILAILIVIIFQGSACAVPAATPASNQASTVAPTQAPEPTAAPTAAAKTAVTPSAAPEPTVATETQSYKPTIRPAKQAWKIGHGNGYAGVDFTAKVSQSINETAQKMGVTVVECDNAADQQKTLACADNFINIKADGVIFASWIPEMAEVLSQKYVDAGLPMVTYDGAHPNAIDFGADNYTAGFLAGKFLGEFAQKNGWDPKATWLVMAGYPAQQVINERLRGAREGVKSVFDVSDGHISEINAEKQGDALNNMTDWLTAHPDAKHVLGFGHSDQPAIELASALESAGRLETSATAGQGASAEALTDLHQRTDGTSAFKATVSYFPEKYGEYLVPVIVDLIEGNPVPSKVYIDHAVIDRSNVDQYYPASK